MEKADTDDDSIGLKIACPVPGCTYTHGSAQGIAGHVGNAHEDGWEAAIASPHELHAAVTLANPGDAHRVAKVRAWLDENEVPVDLFQLYISPRYGTVQVRHRGGQEALYALKVATSGVDAYHYVGDVGYFENKFVDDLPDVKSWPAIIPEDGLLRFEEHPQCTADACDSTRGVNYVLTRNGEKRLLCPSHAKDAMGVTS